MNKTKKNGKYSIDALGASGKVRFRDSDNRGFVMQPHSIEVYRPYFEEPRITYEFSHQENAADDAVAGKIVYNTPQFAEIDYGNNKEYKLTVHGRRRPASDTEVDKNANGEHLNQITIEYVTLEKDGAYTEFPSKNGGANKVKFNVTLKNWRFIPPSDLTNGDSMVRVRFLIRELDGKDNEVPLSAPVISEKSIKGKNFTMDFEPTFDTNGKFSVTDSFMDVEFNLEDYISDSTTISEWQTEYHLLTYDPEITLTGEPSAGISPSVIAGIVLGVLAVGAGAFYFFRKKQKSRASSQL